MSEKDPWDLFKCGHDETIVPICAECFKNFNSKLSLRDRQLEVSRKALEEIQKTIEDDRYPVLTTILNHTLSALQAINEMEGK